MKICIIGAGWLGCHLAMFLKKNNHDVTIYEKNSDIFQESSSKNQNRHHLGFHYPRSSRTRSTCKKYFEQFIQDYGFGLKDLNKCHYYVSKNSSIDYQTYLSIYQQEGFEFQIQDLPEPTTDSSLVDLVIQVKEKYINHQKIQSYFKQHLQNNLKLNSPITQNDIQNNLNLSTTYDFIIDATNNGLNALDTTDCYVEYTISFLYNCSLHETIGITVMDGQFPAIYPYDLSNNQSIYSLTHVKWTPLHTSTPSQSTIQEHRQNMESDIIKYYPDFTKHFSYKSYFISKKVKIVSSQDWRGLYTKQITPNMISMITTKINGIYDAESSIASLLFQPKIALVGYTGFVGSNLRRQQHFTDFYNSKNSNDLINKTFEKIFFCALPAEKWKANKDPEHDLSIIKNLENILSTTKTKLFILISTIDVNLSEPYGQHRLRFEEFIKNQFPNRCLIVRLPALFGMGLKKNSLYDLLHKRDYPIIKNSKFQWYDLLDLWSDIDNNLIDHLIPKSTYLNLYSEPVATSKIINSFFQDDSSFIKYNLEKTVIYDYSPLNYNQSEKKTLNKMKNFINYYRNQQHYHNQLAISNLGMSDHEDSSFYVLKSYGINHLEIALSKVFGSNTNLSINQLLDYRYHIQRSGFTIYSLQAITYGVKDVELFLSPQTRHNLYLHLKKIIDYANILGAKIIVFGSPKLRKIYDNDYLQCYQIATDFFRELAIYADKKNTCLVIEPNAQVYGCEFGYNSKQCRQLVLQVNHPNFRLHLDTACMYLENEDIISTITQNLDILQHFHLSIPYLKPIHQNIDINFQQILTHLIKNNYPHKFSIEMVNNDLNALNKSIYHIYN